MIFLLANANVISERATLSRFGFRPWHKAFGHTVTIQGDTESRIELRSSALHNDPATACVFFYDPEPFVGQIVDDGVEFILRRTVAIEKLLRREKSAFAGRRVLPILQVRKLGTTGFLP